MNNKKMNDILIIQITDTHIFTDQNESFNSINTSQSLSDILEQINSDHPDFDCMITTGDLVQEPEVFAYKNLQNIMSAVDKPVYYLPGNHDDPVMMKGMFGHSFKSVEHLNDWTLLFLNSHKPASHGGYLTQVELEKLRENLLTSKETNVLLCLHHHPVKIDSKWMDEMMLDNSDELFDIIDEFENVRGIIWGHIHQEFTAQRKGLLLMGTPSTGAQFKPGSRKFGIDEMQPGYRWLKLSPDGTIKTGVERLRKPHYHEGKPD